MSAFCLEHREFHRNGLRTPILKNNRVDTARYLYKRFIYYICEWSISKQRDYTGLTKRDKQMRGMRARERRAFEERELVLLLKNA